jgi:hypothetical protein
VGRPGHRKRHHRNADPDSAEISYATSRAGDSAVDDAALLAEVMRATLKSRVATMSMKPRSAIGLAGHGGDFVTWFGERNAWVTSSAFTKTPVGWFVAFLKRNHRRDADKTWERTLPVERYMRRRRAGRAGGGVDGEVSASLGR